VRFALLSSSVLVVALWAQAIPQNAPKRKIPCKTAENTASCYWTHGRLQEYEGTPAYRLWKIGTHHLFGIYSGASTWRRNRFAIDNEDTEFPPNVRKLIRSGSVQVFGDFEVCPLEPERSGFMQAACIQSAKKLFLQK
jgi:hypothetical protein